MSQDEVDTVKVYAKDFEEYMNRLGLMQAHVDMAEADETLRDLHHSASGGVLRPGAGRSASGGQD